MREVVYITFFCAYKWTLDIGRWILDSQIFDNQLIAKYQNNGCLCFNIYFTSNIYLFNITTHTFN